MEADVVSRPDAAQLEGEGATLAPSDRPDARAALPPERVLASPGRRLYAFLVDAAVLSVPMLPLFFAGFRGLPGFGRGQGLIPFATWVLSLTAVSVVYEGVLLTLRGRTFGKMAAGVEVVGRSSGAPVTGSEAWRRAITRAALGLAWLGLLDLLFIFSAERRTLHDRVARTLVVNSNP